MVSPMIIHPSCITDNTWVNYTVMYECETVALTNALRQYILTLNFFNNIFAYMNKFKNKNAML